MWVTLFLITAVISLCLGVAAVALEAEDKANVSLRPDSSPDQRPKHG
jgi:hypothetical protein